MKLSTKYWWTWHLIKCVGGEEYQYAWYRSAYRVAKEDEIKEEIEFKYKLIFQLYDIDFNSYVELMNAKQQEINELILKIRTS